LLYSFKIFKRFLQSDSDNQLSAFEFYLCYFEKTHPQIQEALYFYTYINILEDKQKVRKKE
jgi:hypothetical protein